MMLPRRRGQGDAILLQRRIVCCARLDKAGEYPASPDGATRSSDQHAAVSLKWASLTLMVHEVNSSLASSALAR